MAPGRTTVLSRVTQVLSDYRDAPPAPSNWNDEAHQRHLVRIWDAVDARAAQAKYDVPLLARIISTERNMLHVYPELAQGKIPMNHDWIEYVLGVALRHPFCTAASMGRWEVLASSGGARGTWGPW
ncbi:hypothetical protein CLAFUW4_12616 [Fulvia fulva]|uniref:Uncharacterized protein n=1 Tax=Passalora fulva TaxID=5499 RepID=A0A9Q8PF63_PASFU|nr:uncharacterized protein CLAFUR5_11640 [Fulvia fulva]KAK4617504.1 hypothetical protein CLAFUR4_12621 [Fulvia fulva]KAK4618574.1 hypothetical protein CLAFUR0_12632 [Fulvia fulva]UJO21343.1 hypothetical protein CLAFUR5_11640 [Fulvia fulva]WPV17953.1 hypothetical protein CLAFUW4_12616 [Fulvia fulva]WPV33572.1 hypothetical protein CLAFUW7_12623 [Fulvia fulva]